MAKLAHAASSNLAYCSRFKSGWGYHRLDRVGAYWVKRFGKSERRLTAGQTALICRYGEIRLDTSNLRFDGSNTIWVRIPVAVPGFLSFLVCYSAGTFYLILVIPGSFETMLRSISYRKQQGFVSRVSMQRSYNGEYASLPSWRCGFDSHSLLHCV